MKTRKNILPILLTVVVSLALVAGSTYAWFTATAEPIVNEFTAGTVNISAGYTAGFGKVLAENWNPGDCTDLDLEIVNEGTKSVYLRAKFDKKWLHSHWRVLVVYTGKTVQLLAIEWDSSDYDYPQTNGPIATGKLHIGFPSQTAYIDGIFSNLDSQDYLVNGVKYNAWCVDKDENITKGATYNVEIYDPLTNPDWFLETNSKAIWATIPWDKINYIINANYLGRGYNSDDIQNAIWYYTNNTGILSTEAGEIIADTEANWNLPVDNVGVNPGDDWVLGTDGYWYYKYPVAGSYTESDLAARTIKLTGRVCLNGEGTDNRYQGKLFLLTSFFEAVQSSNGAINDVWPHNPF